MGGPPHQSPAREAKRMARAPRLSHDSPRSLIERTNGEEEEDISPDFLLEVAPAPSASSPAKSAPSTKRPRVAILGGGPAGLAAGQALKRKGLSPIIFEARARPGGRVLSVSLGGDSPSNSSFEELAYNGDDLEKKGKNAVIVDIGASVMHGCGDSNQFVLRRAIAAKIRAPLCAGNFVYESTEAAGWYHKGERIPTLEVTKMHRFYMIAQSRMGGIARRNNDKEVDMRTIWNQVVAQLEKEWRRLTDQEGLILEKICQRAHGYCASMEQMSASQAEFHRPEDPKIKMNSSTVRRDALHFDKMLATNKRLPTPVASMEGGPGDRIVLDGYTPFLIDPMKKGLDIRLENVVKNVRIVQNKGESADKTVRTQDIGPWSTKYNSRLPVSDRGNGLSVETTKPPAEACVVIETADGVKEEFDYAIVALPLGVLQGLNAKSEVKFEPPLPSAKRKAIQSMGMGIHNKIILIFRPEDVFWPEHVAQLNCLDIRFQFFNLHAYGKPGTLLVHVFGESGFSLEYKHLLNRDIAMKAVGVLHKAFCSPVHSNTRVGRTIPRQSVSKKKKVLVPVMRMKPSRRSPRNMDDSIPLNLRRRLPTVSDSDQEALNGRRAQVSQPPRKKLKASKARNNRLGRVVRRIPKKRTRTSPDETLPVSCSGVGNQTEKVTRGSARLSVPLKLALKPPRGMFRKVEEEVLDSSELEAMPPKKKRKHMAGKTEEEILDGDNITPAPQTTGKVVRKGSQVGNFGVEETILDGDTFGAGQVTTPLVAEMEKVIEEVLEEGDANENDDDGVRLPEPIHYHVTRWHEEPFAMGSYSFIPTGADFSIMEVMKTPEKMGTSKNRLFFAGEHLSDLGWQCVHGAHETGVMAANEVLIAAGLRDPSDNFELLDEFPPVPVPVLEPEKEIETIANLCMKFMDSPGQFYDVLDEIIHLYHDSLGKKMSGGGHGRRIELWKTMKEIAGGNNNKKKNPDGGARTAKLVERFMQKRYFKAINESKHVVYQQSFSKRTNKDRPLMKKPEDYEGILEELLKKKSMKGVNQKFAKEVYEKTGAILSLEAIEQFLLEKHEITSEAKQVTAKEARDQKTMDSFTLKSLNYPTLGAFKGWAAGDEEDKFKPRLKKNNKKQSQSLAKKKRNLMPKTEEETLDDNTRVMTRS